MSSQYHAPAGLPPYQLDKGTGWAPEPVWARWRKKSLHTAPAGNRNPVVRFTAGGKSTRYPLDKKGWVGLKAGLFPVPVTKVYVGNRSVLL
jgi:hypothetical protein